MYIDTIHMNMELLEHVFEEYNCIDYLDIVNSFRYTLQILNLLYRYNIVLYSIISVRQGRNAERSKFKPYYLFIY